MTEFRIRVEFDVDVDSSSRIAAAFAAADFLRGVADENRFSYFVYEVASHHDLKDGEGTQFTTIDLEEIQTPDEGEPECTRVEPNIGDTCCGACPGATCYVDQITGERS